MKTIKWRFNKACDFYRAQVGSVVLSCYLQDGNLWLAFADFNRFSKDGFAAKLIDEAKEEAVSLARELLIDHHNALEIEMGNFGIEIR